MIICCSDVAIRSVRRSIRLFVTFMGALWFSWTWQLHVFADPSDYHTAHFLGIEFSIREMQAGAAFSLALFLWVQFYKMWKRKEGFIELSMAKTRVTWTDVV